MADKPIEMQVRNYRSCVAISKPAENYALVKVTVPNQAELGEVRAEMVLVLDCSGSMESTSRETGRTHKEEVIRATKALIDALRPQDRLGVVAFDDSAWLVAPLTAGEVRKKLHDEVDKLQYQGGGGTCMKPALELAMNEIRKNARDARAARVVILTDGDAGDRSATLSYVRSLERQSIASLGFGEFDFDFMNEVCKPSQGLCEEVGGTDPTHVTEVFQNQLHVAQNTVASNVRIRVRPTESDSVLKSYIVHPNPTYIGQPQMGKVREFTIDLPPLDRTEGIEVLLHFRHEPRDKGQYSAAEVAVLYDVPSLGLTNQELVENVILEYVDGTDRRVRETDRSVEMAHERGLNEEVRLRYEDAVAKGDVKAADKALGTLLKSSDSGVRAVATQIKEGGHSKQGSRNLTQGTRQKQSQV